MFVELARADVAEAFAAVGGEKAEHELLVGHFQAEHADGMARLFPGVGRLVVALVERVAREGQRQRGLALAGARGEDDHFARFPAGGEFVELVEAGGQALEMALAVLEILDQLDGLVDFLARGNGRLRQAEIGDVKDRRSRRGRGRRDRIGHVGDVLHDGGAGRLQAAQQALVLDDLDVGADVQVGRETDEQFRQDARTAHGLGQLAVGEPLVDGHDVDGLAGVVHLAQRARKFPGAPGRKNPPCSSATVASSMTSVRLRHHTAEHRLFGFGAVEHRGREHLGGGGGATPLGGFGLGGIGSGHDHGRKIGSQDCDV